MKIIGMDSSGNVASVAYVADGVLVAEYTMNHKKTHSQTLLPMLDQIVRDAGIELTEIDAVAVAAGPGSFTGLRIGAATVKGLGLALEKPVIAIPTCEGLAYNLSSGCYFAPAGTGTETDTGFPGLVVPIMDARRGQVYTGIYRVGGMAGRSLGQSPQEDGQPVILSSEAKDPVTPSEDSSDSILKMTGSPVTVVEDQMAFSIEELLEKLASYGEPVTFLGDGVPVFRKTIEETCRVPYAFAPPQSALQRAASVAALGEYYAKADTEGRSSGEGSSATEAGDTAVRETAAGRNSAGVRHMVSADDFKPIYLRKSQAEREHEAAAKARQAQDLADVAAMEKEMFSDAWSLETLTDSIRYPYNHILLISTEGEIRPLVSEEDVADSFVVGEEEQKTAGYLIFADPSDEAELHRIAVLPEFRRHGLGKQLMAELLRRTGNKNTPVSSTGKRQDPDSAEGMLEAEPKSIFLEVRAGNAAAIALYTACEFRELDRRKNYYRDPEEDAVIMKRDTES